MFTIEGICDWCKKPSMLAKHEYVDGLCHHSCKECNDLATLDVRQFNIAELQQRERNPNALR
ncbi:MULTISPECIES: hypothetical protein [Vibrio]|jgi:hypothetical protein|uniref:Uncharacterized protein n=1 Tax=Vibrio ouci TaxID=2499078 RepID=A0A4Y8WDF7_9VIBR|nr:hypothetical protein [Vibrio ouci]TFH90939.1 hypothetical protein ELS82_14520 [Vibrio ouci]